MAPLSIDPRSLNADERAVLEHILSAEFVGALQVREPCEHATLPTELVPADAHVHNPSGAYVGEILVRTDRGAMLAALEFAWVTRRDAHVSPSRRGRPPQLAALTAVPALSTYGPAAGEIAT
ncbi:hypothetical protein [Streptomyces sp. NPDC051079]|uniref:hypothetical protein n=1 Tax=Streptomyces sp. NPDC051079 TaxID=3155043 RepID=UPI00344BCD04